MEVQAYCPPLLIMENLHYKTKLWNASFTPSYGFFFGGGEGELFYFNIQIVETYFVF